MFNYLDIQFPTLDMPLSKSAEFNHSHARYEHEIIKVYFSDWAVQYQSMTSGTPVTVNLSGVGSSRTINGYIHHIQPDISPEKNFVEVTIIGASYLLKQESQQVWVDVTADQVVADVATKNGFSYNAVPTQRVYDQISQAGRSDWELLVDLAKQNGYSLKADNTTIMFQPLTQEFTDLRAQAAYYKMNGLDTKKTGIYSFKPLIGDSIPYENIKKASVAIGGVNRETAVDHVNTNQKMITTTRTTVSPLVFDTYQTSVVAPTFQIAKFESDAADERNRYAYRGTATLQGSPTLLPDAPVYLDGLGPSYSGFWTVLSVNHYLEREVFTTTIEIGTDSLGLAGKWTDNKDVVAPEASVKRVITPGVRQKNIVPKTSLKKAGTTIRKNASAHVSAVKNMPKAIVKSTPSHKWVGTSGNVRKPAVPDKKMPFVVLNKKLAGK